MGVYCNQAQKISTTRILSTLGCLSLCDSVTLFFNFNVTQTLHGIHLRKFVNTDLPQAGFDLKSLGLQTGVLPIEPPVLVYERLLNVKKKSKIKRIFPVAYFC